MTASVCTNSEVLHNMALRHCPRPGEARLDSAPCFTFPSRGEVREAGGGGGSHVKVPRFLRTVWCVEQLLRPSRLDVSLA